MAFRIVVTGKDGDVNPLHIVDAAWAWHTAKAAVDKAEDDEDESAYEDALDALELCNDRLMELVAKDKANNA